MILSERTPYIHNNEITYLDIRSINIIIRSMHEMYLVYEYLNNLGLFGENINKKDELDFKALIYEYSGAKDNLKTIDIMQSMWQIEQTYLERKDEIESKKIYYGLK